jgi:hypothetical protein
MELKVFEDNPSEVYLKLEKVKDKVILRVVDSKGGRLENGDIIDITPEGITFYPRLGDFGFKREEYDHAIKLLPNYI